QTRLVAEAEATEEQHEASTRELKAASASHLDAVKKEHEIAFAKQDNVWKEKLSELDTKHREELALALQTSEVSAAAKLKDAEGQHAATLSTALEAAQADAQDQISKLRLSH